MQQPCRAGVQCMQQPCTWFCRVSLHLAGVRLTRQPCQLTDEPCIGGIGISGFGRIGGEGHNVIDGSGSRGCSVLQGRNAIFPCQWSWRANCDRGSGVSTFKDGADVGVGGGLARRGGGRIFLAWSGDLVLFFGLWWRRLRRRRSRQPLRSVPRGERGEEVWVVVRSGGMEAELKLERRDGRQSWSVATVGGVFFHGLKKTVSEVKEKKNKGFGSGGRNRNTCIQKFMHHLVGMSVVIQNGERNSRSCLSVAYRGKP